MEASMLRSAPALSRPVIRITFACSALLAAAGLFASPARANEVMTERCSGEVSIVPDYNAKAPFVEGTHILKRDKSGNHPWTEAFSVKPDGSGHIRWWCHSTIGNLFDPGTWRVHGDVKGAFLCLAKAGKDAAGGTVTGAAAGGKDCAKKGKSAPSAVRGWTPGRSRGRGGTTKARPRLGPNRLLQIECL